MAVYRVGAYSPKINVTRNRSVAIVAAVLAVIGVLCLGAYAVFVRLQVEAVRTANIVSASVAASFEEAYHLSILVKEESLRRLSENRATSLSIAELNQEIPSYVRALFINIKAQQKSSDTPDVQSLAKSARGEESPLVTAYALPPFGDQEVMQVMSLAAKSNTWLSESGRSSNSSILTLGSRIGLESKYLILSVPIFGNQNLSQSEEGYIHTIIDYEELLSGSLSAPEEGNTAAFRIKESRNEKVAPVLDLSWSTVGWLAATSASKTIGGEYVAESASRITDNFKSVPYHEWVSLFLAVLFGLIAIVPALGALLKGGQSAHMVESLTKMMELKDEQIRSLSEGSPCGVLLLSGDGQGLFANAALADMSGYDTKDLRGSGWESLLSVESRKKLMATSQSEKSPSSAKMLQLKLRGNNGKRVSCLVKRVSMHRRASLAGIICFFVLDQTQKSSAQIAEDTIKNKEDKKKHIPHSEVRTQRAAQRTRIRKKKADKPEMQVESKAPEQVPQAEPAALPQAETVDQTNDKKRSEQRVLLIESLQANREHFTRLLESEGFQVTVEGTIKAGMSRLRDSNFNLVVVDSVIPTPKLSEIRKLCQISEGTPIVAVVSKSSPKQTRKFLKAGCKSTLSKPCTPEQFFAVIGECVENAQPSPAEEESSKDHTSLN